jgi:hypothetical protein
MTSFLSTFNIFELPHFAEGSPDTSYGFRILRNVSLTPVGASAFCRSFPWLWLRLSHFAEGLQGVISCFCNLHTRFSNLFFTSEQCLYAARSSFLLNNKKSLD